MTTAVAPNQAPLAFGPAVALIEATFGPPRLGPFYSAVLHDDEGRFARWGATWFPYNTNHSFSFERRPHFHTGDLAAWLVRISTHDPFKPHIEWRARREPTLNEITHLFSLTRFLELPEGDH